MSNGWDAHWREEANRPYWEQPAPDVVEFVSSASARHFRDVLDLGCGIGRHTGLLLDAGWQVTAVDSSSEALMVLERNFGSFRDQLTVVRASYDEDVFAANSFDFVLAYNVIYHGVRDTMGRAMQLVRQWLRPGGLFFFTCPTRRDGKYRDGICVGPHTFRPTNSVHPGDVHYFADERNLNELLRGFEVETSTLNEHYWDNEGRRQFSSYRRVIARKSA
jgi:tellurite methyltransferase